jgi:protein-L-isoaspartate(D-aspartate) O-methyltransferase
MLHVNFETARYNMIEQQIRPWEILDQRILDLISDVPREDFVPKAYRNLAFVDTNTPLAHEQTMMSPKLEGRLLQALNLTQKETVLEIGTGSGYLTALLAKLAKHVDSVDIVDEFVKEAATKLNAFQNISLNTGDAINGWNSDTRYDVIVLTGSVPLLNPHFQAQLKDGGRLFAIVGEEPVMQAHLISRFADDFYTDILFETSLPPLLGAVEPDHFML